MISMKNVYTRGDLKAFCIEQTCCGDCPLTELREDICQIVVDSDTYILPYEYPDSIGDRIIVCRATATGKPSKPVNIVESIIVGAIIGTIAGSVLCAAGTILANIAELIIDYVCG